MEASDGFDNEGLRDDLGDLPDYFRDEDLGPTGEAAFARAGEIGLDLPTAILAGDAAHAAAWKKTEQDFKAELLSIADAPGLLFAAVRDLLAREGLWPWGDEAE